MQTVQISFGDAVSQCVEVIRSRLGLISVTIFLIAAGFYLFDLFSNKRATFIPSFFVNIFVQYHFVEAILLGRVAASQKRRRKYSSLFFAGLLATLGIIAGLIVLIIPGIFLMARWSISTPFIVVEGMSGSEALRASWQATSESRWMLFGMILLCCAALCVPFFGIVLAMVVFHLTQDNVFLSFASNVLASLWVVGGWILGVGIYRALKPSSDELAEVFA